MLHMSHATEIISGFPGSHGPYAPKLLANMLHSRGTEHRARGPNVAC